jgi:probable HAF family extracellular repeat protein
VAVFVYCAHVVHLAEFEGWRYQSEFVVCVLQSTGAKLVYSTLLFEDSEDRFDDGICTAPNAASGNIAYVRPSLPRPSTISSLVIFIERSLLSHTPILSAACLTLTFLWADTALAQEDNVSTTSTVARAAAIYTIDDLGPLAPVADDVTVSLNRNGAVAYWTKASATIHATQWHSGKATNLNEVAGYPNNIAHAINRHGDMAGWMNTSGNLVDSLSTTRGFIQHHGRLRIVPTLGGRDSRVNGLNDKGAAVGAANLTGGARHAFVISGSSIADLGTLPSGKSSSAIAINNAGVIVGEADIDGKSYHAVLWMHRKIVDLGTLAHGVVSTARAINDHSQIVGFSDTPEGVHAFLYTGGLMRDLGTLGNDPSEASGINNRGDVVGASNISGTKRHAFLWRDGRMTDLNAYLPEGSDWILLNAFNINDRGQIACSARRKGEPIHLLLLTPR